jgi:hypothetical protein
MRKTAEMSGGKPIAIWSQSISWMDETWMTTSMDERERCSSLFYPGHHTNLTYIPFTLYP